MQTREPRLPEHGSDTTETAGGEASVASERQQDGNHGDATCDQGSDDEEPPAGG